MSFRHFFSSIIFAAAAVFLPAGPGRAEAGRPSGLETRIRAMIPAGGAQVGVSVVDLESGQTLAAVNDKMPLKPASVLKLLVSLVALRELGPDYTFRTLVFADSFRDSAVERLYVKGGGDPGLEIQSALIIARALRNRGIKKAGELVLDGSLFVEDSAPAGQRAYQTGSSALSFDYNSITFRICPTKPGKPAEVFIDPWEIPLKLKGTVQTTSGSGHVAIDQLEGDRPAFALGGTVGMRDNCVVHYRSIANPEQVFGAVLGKFLESSGIKLSKSASSGSVPSHAVEVYAHVSQPLKRIVEDLNHFSNNFIAEQLLYALGLQTDGRMSRDAGLQRLGGYLRIIGIPETEFRLEDASGLSHGNLASARLFTRLLSQAFSDVEVGTEFINSLSVAGQSGTLKKRSFGLESAAVRAKTGTIDGVSTLGGYVFTRKGRKFSFCILQNSVSSKDEAVRRENAIVALIAGL